MYFKDLPYSTKEIVTDALLTAMDNVEGWKFQKDLISEIECIPRDGFNPAHYNRGGLTATQFTNLLTLWASGSTVSHAKARAEIERQIEYSLECARESFFSDYKDTLQLHGITSLEEVEYQTLIDLSLRDLAEKRDQYEMDILQDTDSSIMFEIRFMFTGINSEGEFEALVSSVVNTEGPYHRSSIPWAPSVFCEGGLESAITWANDEELKSKLNKLLKKQTDEVF